MTESYVSGWIETAAGKIPMVPAQLSAADRLGTFRVRLAVNRMNYRVPPGLYAVGSPDQNSAVLVSANFKLSFDTLRQNLKEIDAWILVLDTKGVNVWCAAGKGTFGTEEIVRRIESTGLSRVVNHGRLVVPQLGASGVAAHEVKKSAGFEVIYGPVRASDIRPFLEAGMKATRRMRRVEFRLVDRARLVPTEVIASSRYLFAAILVFLLLAGLGAGGYSVRDLVQVGVPSGLNLLLAYLVGTVLGLLLLPWLPGRAFSFKGFVLGVFLFVVLLVGQLVGDSGVEIAGWALLIPCTCSFIVLNLTGSSTYTSLSGVRKEMRVAVPMQIAAGFAGSALWIAGRFA
jgi:acetyl-CoA decarbonylase/synthase complex subunit gamma